MEFQGVLFNKGKCTGLSERFKYEIEGRLISAFVEIGWAILQELN